MITAFVWMMNSNLKNEWLIKQQQANYEYTTQNIKQKVSTLIEEKKNATLTIGLSLAQSSDLRDALIFGKDVQPLLQKFSAKLNKETEFRNVWMQLIDKHGVCITRSWIDKRGDNIAAIRPDVQQMIANPKINSTISVGQFDMTFKAMVPLYDQNSQFIGYLETLTHFNSIAEKIKAEGFEPIILADKRYKQQLTKPFTGLFAGEYYVANQNANPKLLTYLLQKGVNSFIYSHDSYSIDMNTNDFIVTYLLEDVNNDPMGIFLLFKPLTSFDTTVLENTKTIIDLSSLSVIILSAFILFLLSKKDQTLTSSSPSLYRYSIFFVAFFLIAALLFYLVIDLRKRNIQQAYIQDYTQKISQDYRLASAFLTSPIEIILQLSATYDLHAEYLISKTIIDRNSTQHEQSYFPNFYNDTTLKKKLQHVSRYFHPNNIDPTKLTEINNRILKGKIFTVLSRDNLNLYAFIPLMTKGEVVGVMVFEKETPMLKNQEQTFLLFMIMGIASILFMTLFIYRETIAKTKFKLLSQQTKLILDSQRTIVVIGNGKLITDANQSFLDFFGFADLDHFRTYYSCICNRFINDDRYFHLEKVISEATWIETLLTLPEKERIVLMENNQGERRSFNVSINRFGEENAVITFSDISETLNEKHSLSEKVTRDQLTHVYNREFLDSHITPILASVHLRNKQLALILVDIDHFKKVNDTYGHNRGDTILQELTTLVQSALRSDDYLIRWGGEEFILLLMVGSINEAMKIGENLRKRVEEHHFEEVQAVTCSFGVTLHREDEPIEITIERADQALYDAKACDRNCVKQK